MCVAHIDAESKKNFPLIARAVKSRRAGVRYVNTQPRCVQVRSSMSASPARTEIKQPARGAG